MGHLNQTMYNLIGTVHRGVPITIVRRILPRQQNWSYKEGLNFMSYINDICNQNQSSQRNPGPTLLPLFNYKQDITYKYMKLNFNSSIGNPETHSETWFCRPQEDFYETHCITHTYAKFLGKLPTTSELPRRKVTHLIRPNTHPNIYIDFVDDLIETVL